MFDVKVLSQEQIKSIVSVHDALDAVEEVYALKAKGQTSVWPLVTYDFEVGVSDMDIKSGYVGGIEIYGMKAVSYFSRNADVGLPNLIGVLVVYDAKNGIPLGVLDAGYITCLRTGAAGALGIKYLSRENSKIMAMIGAGKQAIYQMTSAICVRPGLEQIKIYSRSFDKSAKLASDAPQIMAELGVDASGVCFSAVGSPEDAVSDADIVVTATPSRSPIVMNAYVKEGTHFSCVGSDVSGKQEIDENILSRAKIYTDDTAQCIKVGEIETGIKKNIITPEDICGELGQVITGQICGRSSDKEITLFDSTGIAIQDLITAKKVLDIAAEKNIGTIVDL